MKRLIGLGALAMLVALGCAEHTTNVVIHNGGASDLDSVWVFATGDSAFLGTIAAGQEVEGRLHPRGESHLEITHRGRADRIVVDVYLEPGTRGPVRVETDGQVARAEHRDR